MSVKPVKTNTWKLQRCKACGEHWGKSLIHGIGLVCRECWATLAPPALAGKGHKAERKAEKIDRLLREHQPPPMARSAEMLELRGCARCGGAVNWIRTTDRAPGWWEGECVGCGDIRFSGLVADAKVTRGYRRNGGWRQARLPRNAAGTSCATAYTVPAPLSGCARPPSAQSTSASSP